MKAFDREGEAYTWWIPALQKLREEKQLKPLAFPKCVYSSEEECLLMMENLKKQNFEVIPKKAERNFFFFTKKLFYNIHN